MSAMETTNVKESPASAIGAPILEVRDLAVHFRARTGWLGRMSEVRRAVDGVSWTLRRGETLGLVGESGCGKSTTARAILRLVKPTAGVVRLNVADADQPDQWVDLAALSAGRLRRTRRHIQMVFQDPHASLNPRMTVGDAIAEPMRIFSVHRRREIPGKVQELLTEVGLSPRFVNAYPHQLSGGMRQRVGIARALALDPAVILCDEPVSALDVSIRSDVLNLLLRLQQRRGLAYLFISHDLSVVKKISHRVAVMYKGKIVELASHASIYSSRKHPYTQALLSAIPIPDPIVEASRQRILLREEPIDADKTSEPTGCPFAPRCPEAKPICSTVAPNLAEVAPGHWASCLLYPPSAPEGVSPLGEGAAP